MKCIQLGDQVVRVTDDEAAALVAQGEGQYVNKDMWRKFKARHTGNKKRGERFKPKKGYQKARHPSN